MRKMNLIFLMSLLPITLLAQGGLDGIEISNTTLATENNSSPGTLILPDIIPTSTAEQTEAFNFIMQYQMGVAGTGFYKKDEYIGLCSAEYAKVKKGGGIAGDFPICVVPMMYQDLEWHDVPFWSYFCQISDSTTSYGSYSGAVPNEKITWGKLDINTPKFIVESDATIVAPLIFAWVLGW